MLIGDAERFDGGLTHAHKLAVNGLFLAEGFCPELSIPIRHVFQAVRIGHEDGDIRSLLHCEHFERSAYERGIFKDILI